MGQLLHKNATTTHRVREEIQASLESAGVLSARYGVSKNTIYKWKKRAGVGDAPIVKNPAELSVLTLAEQQVCCETRKKTRLPLDDLFEVLKPHIPALTRSNLHRCLQRSGLSKLPSLSHQEKGKKKNFKSYPPGYFHVDTTEIRIQKAKYQLFVAIDRTTKFAYAELHKDKTAAAAAGFLAAVAAACPYKIHTVLTDNGSEYTYELLPAERRPKGRAHPFDAAVSAAGAKHRLTQFRHPWTNGQVEVMNRKIKNATVKEYFYEDEKTLREHLYHWLLGYNFHRKLKALKRKTPWEAVLDFYAEKPELFTENPHNKDVGSNN